MVAASRCPAVPNLCRVRRGAAQQDRVRVGGVAALLDPGFQASAWMHFMCSTTRMLRRARCMRHHSSFAVQCNPTTAGGCRAWTPPPPAPLSPCTTSCTAWAYRWAGVSFSRGGCICLFVCMQICSASLPGILMHACALLLHCLTRPCSSSSPTSPPAMPMCASCWQPKAWCCSSRGPTGRRTQVGSAHAPLGRFYLCLCLHASCTCGLWV